MSNIDFDGKPQAKAIGFFAMLSLVYTGIGTALMTLIRGINTADMVMSVAEDHAYAFKMTERAKLEHRYKELTDD